MNRTTGSCLPAARKSASEPSTEIPSARGNIGGHHVAVVGTVVVDDLQDGAAGFPGDSAGVVEQQQPLAKQPPEPQATYLPAWRSFGDAACTARLCSSATPGKEIRGTWGVARRPASQGNAAPNAWAANGQSCLPG
jgi:hypothetical protein